MKDYYSKYTNEYSWLVKEEGWVRSLQRVRESQFALGNGFLGSRGVLEELPYDARPGTFIAGLYDNIGSQVAELVNLPNPFNFKIVIDGENLGVATMDVIKHTRILNLRHGFLVRHTIFKDTQKRRYDLQSLRFLSMHEKNIGVMQIIFTPLDAGIKASIETGIDTSVYNSGTVTEGPKKHFRIKEAGQFRNEGYLIIENFGKTHTVIFRSGFHYQTRGRLFAARNNIFELELRKNQTVVFTKVFYITLVSKDEDLEKQKKLSEERFRKTFRSSFKSLINKHILAWEDLWNVAEVSIWGDQAVEKAFRFNIYHMLICAPRDAGISSVGARAMTGEGYHGHIFWDAEIFILPFYVFVFPEAARNMLLYRYVRLDAARENAKKHGYKGAMFPWESAGSGKDETPGWAKDLDGKIIKISTGQQEHHITADIAYATHYYYTATGDERFLRDYGYEVLFETARFWASRVEYNKKKKKYEIKHVIGPDEFHNNVNNNAYTNMMAKWNLHIAYRMFQKIKKSEPAVLKKLSHKLRLSAEEPVKWRKIASRISIKMNKQRIIEQFEGYFKKKEIKITHLDENSLPIVTKKITPRDYGKTQLVKQADVIMLLYLLSDFFNMETKRRNYEYYVNRTLHKSSLSLPIYALMGIELSDRSRSYHLFHNALRTDLSNIHNNTEEGIHAACMGGVWQVLVNGFAGVRIQKEILSINPKLPSAWRKVLFSLYWNGNLLRLEVKNDSVKIQHFPLAKKRIEVRIFGSLCELTGRRTFSFKRSKPAEKIGAYYL